MIYVQQNGSLGKSIPYPSSAHPKATIATGGCGVCSSLMVLLNSTSYTVGLKEWTKKVIACGGRVAEGTDMSKVASMMCSKYGFTCETTTDINKLKAHLQKGYKAVCHVGKKGYFSSSGHFVCGAGVKSDGKAIILDPYYYSGKWISTVNGINRSKYFKYDSSSHEVYCSFDVIANDRKGYYYLLTPTKKVVVTNSTKSEIPGADISSYQKGLSLKTLKSAGNKFVILRGGLTHYGDLRKEKDSTFESFYKEAKNNGLPVGVYYYSCANTKADGIAEANFLYNNCLKGKKFEYPIYIDVENNQHQRGKKKGTTEAIIGFCETLEAKGFWVGIYACYDWFTNQIDTSKLVHYDKWVADYRSKRPAIPWSNSHMLQYTSSMKVGGQKIDGDKCYVDYPTLIKKNHKNGF